MEYRIEYVGDRDIKEVHHIGIQYDGNYYSVVYGRYVNGGFFSIPNWNYGGELATFDDIFWNTESIGRAIKNKQVGRAIAKAIAESEKRGIENENEWSKGNGGNGNENERDQRSKKNDPSGIGGSDWRVRAYSWQV